MTEMDNLVAINVRYEGGNRASQIFQLSPKTQWRDLEAMLKVQYDCKHVEVFYVDTDGDYIALSSQEELEEAFKIAQNCCSNLHFKLRNITGQPKELEIQRENDSSQTQGGDTDLEIMMGSSVDPISGHQQNTEPQKKQRGYFRTSAAEFRKLGMWFHDDRKLLIKSKEEEKQIAPTVDIVTSSEHKEKETEELESSNRQRDEHDEGTGVADVKDHAMASEKHVPCGPCRYDDVTKDATWWCTNCEEGVCKECENAHRKSKTSRNHKVISIKDYRKIENVSISQVCEHHGENLEWFCKTHDKALCIVCVPSNHRSCSDVIPISVASSNAKQSTAISDLEDAIEGILLNVRLCIKNREFATKKIEKQELVVKNMILETRTKVNLNLDKLERKLLRELRATTYTCKSKYIKFLKNLESTEEMLTKLREQTLHMSQFSSDIQLFLGTCQINKQINSEIQSIKREIRANKDYEFKVSIHSIIEKLSNEVENFGQIKISECNVKFDFRDPEIDQAQIGINVLASRNISTIQLQLIKTFRMKKREGQLNISACVILPNGHMLIANGTNANQLIEFSDIGRHIRDVQVSYMPFDIALIDPDHIVVTYGDAKFLEIINRNTFNVEKKIRLQKSCLGVSHEDGRLCVAHRDSVQVLDSSGRLLKTMKTESMGVTRICASKDKIFYLDCNKNKVHCCHVNGEELWQFQCDSIKFPRGVTADNYNNVFVVGYISKNLTIVQHYGKTSKTLLTESDGLPYPRTVYYDKAKRTLVICSDGGKVTVYKVI